MRRKIAVGAVVLALTLTIVACSAPAAATATQKPVQIPTSTPAAASAPAANPTTTPPSNPRPAGNIKEVWIDPKVSGNTVSIAENDVKNNWNNAFKIVNNGATLNFMAYVMNGEIQVRANVCPPCRSIGYNLTPNDVLVCVTCGTSFKAVDGSGIQGACVKFPKAGIQYKVENGNLVMSVNDLVNAYQKTVSGNG